MRKAEVALTLVSAILITAIAGTCVGPVKANPFHNFYHEVEGITPPNAVPPVILLSSEASGLYGKNDFSFTLNISTSGETLRIGLSGQPSVDYPPYIKGVYYATDWQQNRKIIYETNKYTTFSERISQFSHAMNLTDVPDGTHTIIVNAVEWNPTTYVQGEDVGNALSWEVYCYGYNVNGSLTITFTVDTTPPSITNMSLRNKTYTLLDADLLDVPLDFSINETALQISYSLDDQANVTISGNTTLIGLTEGSHTIAVYASDSLGNIGSSETSTFTISRPEPFPVMTVTASLGFAALVSASLLVYFKKLKDRKQNKESRLSPSFRMLDLKAYAMGVTCRLSSWVQWRPRI